MLLVVLVVLVWSLLFCGVVVVVGPLPSGIHRVVLSVQGDDLQDAECKLHMTTDHPCRAETDTVVSWCVLDRLCRHVPCTLDRLPLVPCTLVTRLEGTKASRICEHGSAVQECLAQAGCTSYVARLVPICSSEHRPQSQQHAGAHVMHHNGTHENDALSTRAMQ